MTEEIFHDIIYKVRGPFWADHKCGSGSLLEHTATVREHLPIIVDTFNIKSMLDAPCGDFSWMHHVQFPQDLKYTGGDIVGRMIEENKSTYPNVDFVKIDVVNDTLPTVDLLFCRDLLIHLPCESIKKIFRNVLASNIKYVLVSSCVNEHNNDIDHGQHREVNLERSPFLFPSPLYTIDDTCRHVVRNMLLWDAEQIAAVVDQWDN